MLAVDCVQHLDVTQAEMNLKRHQGAKYGTQLLLLNIKELQNIVKHVSMFKLASASK